MCTLPTQYKPSTTTKTWKFPSSKVNSRLIDGEYGEVSSGSQKTKQATHNPFAGLAGLIKEKKD